MLSGASHADRSRKKSFLKKDKNAPSIVLVGSGNVGSQLGKRLYKRGQNVVQVFSRKAEKAHRLGDAIKADWTDDLNKIVPDADLYILGIHDDFIDNVAAKLSKIIDSKSLITHTSGATPSTVFKPYFKRYGVFYPLQTFNIAKTPNWANIPVCLHTNRKADLEILQKIADRISRRVYQLNDKKRGVAHVAAVFANNFSNHVYSIASDILEKEELPFDLIRPLILETAEKMKTGNPKAMQTGPAVRGDEETIERHLKYLKKNKDQLAVYKLLTDQITKSYKS